MKLHIVSDFHLDASHELFRMPRIDCDAVVIAGDICEGPVKAVQWVARRRLGVPVVMIAGNHEAYGTDLHQSRADALAEAAKHPHVHLMQDSTVVLGGVRFVGATLWSDYRLDGEAWRTPAMLAARSMMSDHRAIRTDGGKGYWTPADAATEHQASRDYIAAVLREPFAGPTVVVTHHAPSSRSVHARYHGSVLNGAYASNLDHLVDRCDLWVHGHVHKRQDYRIGDGRVVCNPRGYGHEDSGFDPGLVVEVEKVRETV